MIQNCKIISHNTDVDVYRRQTNPRGHPEFICSSGMLRTFLECPRRWVLGYGQDEESTDSTDWGSLIDSRWLTPMKFREQSIVRPATYPAPKTHAKVKSGEIAEGDPIKWNSNATICADWESRHEGLKIVKSDDFAQSDLALERLAGFNGIIDRANKQTFIMGEYSDKSTGLNIYVRALVDILPFNGRTVYDLKTCRSADPANWNRVVFDHGYHVQAALYLDMVNDAIGEDRTDFVHILSENVAPYETGLALLSQEFIEMGRATYRQALELYAQCLMTGVWPSYHVDQSIEGMALIQPEPWMAMKSMRAGKVVNV